MARVEDIISQARLAHPNADVELIRKAYAFAAKAHIDQYRTSGEPYLIHPVAVAAILADWRFDVPTVVTGLLHDTVEDAEGVTQEIIEKEFGKDVAFLVDGVTKLEQIKTDNKEDRAAENFRKMLVAMAKDIRVIVVKLADRLHNMRTLGYVKPEKQARVATETLDIYAPLAHRLGMYQLKAELEDLCFKYLHADEYANIEKQLANTQKARERQVQAIVSLLSAKMAENGLKADITGRNKHLFSIYKKLKKKGSMDIGAIHDLMAFRVIVGNSSDCYAALGVVHATGTPVPGRFKDYISIPKNNFYQSLHTTIALDQGQQVEVQIRTLEMHRIAEEGVAAHWRYKENSGSANRDEKIFAWLRRLMEWQQDVKDNSEFMENVRTDLATDEVYVLTPKGKPIELPVGSTPVDLAYAIHSEVGDHCTGAKVNGVIVPLRHVLRNGDTVEIITSQNQKPNKDWLEFVKSTRAKTRIRSFVRSHERERSLQFGADMMEHEARKVHKSFQKMLKNGEFKDVPAALKIKDMDEVLRQVGHGKLTAAAVLAKAMGEEEMKAALQKQDNVLSRIIEKVSGAKSKTGVRIQGIDDVMVNFAKCCNPLPGDQILGFVSQGHGMNIHRVECESLDALSPDRLIDVVWDVDEESPMFRPVMLKVFTSDAPGILANLSNAISKAGINISEANCKVVDTDHAVNTFQLLVKSTNQLDNLINSLRRMRFVRGIERV